MHYVLWWVWFIRMACQNFHPECSRRNPQPRWHRSSLFRRRTRSSLNPRLPGSDEMLSPKMFPRTYASVLAVVVATAGLRAWQHETAPPSRPPSPRRRRSSGVITSPHPEGRNRVARCFKKTQHNDMGTGLHGAGMHSSMPPTD